MQSEKKYTAFQMSEFLDEIWNMVQDGKATYTDFLGIVSQVEHIFHKTIFT